MNDQRHAIATARGRATDSHTVALGNVPNPGAQSIEPVRAANQAISELENSGIHVSPEVRSKLLALADTKRELAGGVSGIDRAAFIRELTARVIDPGKRVQGNNAFCLNSDLSQEGLSGTAYIERVCDLALTGRTMFRNGAIVHIPAGYSFRQENDKGRYRSLAACDWLLMSALDDYCTGGSRAVGQGLYAREAERGAEALLGHKVTVVYGLAAAVAAAGRAKNNQSTIMSVQWDADGRDANHGIVMQGTEGDRSRISNPWGRLLQIMTSAVKE